MNIHFSSTIFDVYAGLRFCLCHQFLLAASLPRSESLADKHHGKTDINPFLCHVIRHKWRLPRYLDDWMVTWLVNPYETISDHLLYPTVCAVSCKIGRTETPGHLNKTTLVFFSEGDTLGVPTTDTAHVPWFSHCFATIDNFCFVFLQWLNKTKIQKNKKTKHQKKKNHKMTRPNSLPLLPPLGCAFFVFLVSGSLLFFLKG